MKLKCLPEGFEEFYLEELAENLCQENLKDDNKELVLISAPGNFDAYSLKGKQFIKNGSQSLIDEEFEDQEPVFRWDLHASSAGSDKHLNILLPSKMTDRHVIAQDIAMNLNVVRNIHIPTAKLPKKKKGLDKLLKPTGLRARWAPFGSEYPLHGNGKIISAHKKINIDGSANSVDHLSSLKEEDIDPAFKKKEKKKKKREREFSENNTSDTLSVVHNFKEALHNIKTEDKRNIKEEVGEMIDEKLSAPGVIALGESVEAPFDNKKGEKKRRKRKRKASESFTKEPSSDEEISKKKVKRYDKIENGHAELSMNGSYAYTSFKTEPKEVNSSPNDKGGETMEAKKKKRVKSKGNDDGNDSRMIPVKGEEAYTEIKEYREHKDVKNMDGNIVDGSLDLSDGRPNGILLSANDGKMKKKKKKHLDAHEGLDNHVSCFAMKNIIKSEAGEDYSSTDAVLQVSRSEKNKKKKKKDHANEFTKGDVLMPNTDKGVKIELGDPGSLPKKKKKKKSKFDGLNNCIDACAVKTEIKVEEPQYNLPMDTLQHRSHEERKGESGDGTKMSSYSLWIKEEAEMKPFDHSSLIDPIYSSSQSLKKKGGENSKQQLISPNLKLEVKAETTEDSKSFDLVQHHSHTEKKKKKKKKKRDEEYGSDTCDHKVTESFSSPKKTKLRKIDTKFVYHSEDDSKFVVKKDSTKSYELGFRPYEGPRNEYSRKRTVDMKGTILVDDDVESDIDSEAEDILMGVGNVKKNRHVDTSHIKQEILTNEKKAKHKKKKDRV